ncbi:MAG: 4-oxalocrotonate decarboxylase [bacterium]|nr:4-oxalocrotonate decarboxylase [bacterium]
MKKRILLIGLFVLYGVLFAGADEKTAYEAQKAYVEKRLLTDKCAGFKAGLTSRGIQKRFGIGNPVSGVLFHSGKHTGGSVIGAGDYKRLMIETEIGFVVGKAITRPLDDAAELSHYIRAVVPAVELPDLCFREPGKLNALDIIAGNVSAKGFIKGEKKEIKGLDFNAVSVVLYRDGEVVNKGTGSDALGDQRQALLWLVNAVLKQGWTIEPGHVLLTGALGKMIPGKRGNYIADYGGFGKITFDIK